jgi:membrane protease YdiL (CAAX protease family)
MDVPQISKSRALFELLVPLGIFLIASGILGLVFYFSWFTNEPFGLEHLEFLQTPEGINNLLEPGLYATPFAMLLAFLSVVVLLKIRGEGLKNIGLSWQGSAGSLAIWSGLIVIVLYATAFLITNGMNLLDVPQSTGGFEIIIGNLPLYLFAMTAISWFSAGFCEEVIFRGFFIRNLSVVTGNSDVGLTIAVVLQAAVFALLHLNQDYGGAIAVFALALVFGFLFIKLKKGLWPLIIAHALFDNIQISILYFFSEITA